MSGIEQLFKVVIYTTAGNVYSSIPYTADQVKHLSQEALNIGMAKSIVIDTNLTESGSETIKRIFVPSNIEHMYIRELKL